MLLLSHINSREKLYTTPAYPILVSGNRCSPAVAVLIILFSPLKSDIRTLISISASSTVPAIVLRIFAVLLLQKILQPPALTKIVGIRCCSSLLASALFHLQSPPNPSVAQDENMFGGGISVIGVLGFASPIQGKRKTELPLRYGRTFGPRNEIHFIAGTSNMGVR